MLDKLENVDKIISEGSTCVNAAHVLEDFWNEHKGNPCLFKDIGISDEYALRFAERVLYRVGRQILLEGENEVNKMAEDLKKAKN